MRLQYGFPSPKPRLYRHFSWAALLLALQAPASPAFAQSDDSIRKRPVIGETPKYVKDWWSWTNAQRRQGGYIYNEEGGDLNPRLNDPAIRTWRDKNGYNIRPFYPQDVRSALEMQKDVLGDMKNDLIRQERSNNADIRQSKIDAREAKDVEAAEKSRKSLLESERTDIERRWSTSRYHLCPKGNTWAGCSHEDLKDSWNEQRDRELKPILRGIEQAEQNIQNARDKGLRAYETLQDARKKRDELQDRVETYQDLKGRQNRAEPFLFMPK